MPTALNNPYRFIVTAMNGAVIGELTNARNRKVSVPINGIPSASAVIAMSHPLAVNVLNDDLLLKVYRGSTLIFHGPVTAAQESATAEERTLSITASGVWWRYTKRLLPSTLPDAGWQSTAGYQQFGFWLDEVNNVAFSGVTF